MDEEIQLQTTDSKIESIADNRYKERQTYRQQMDIDGQQTIENDGDEKVDQHEEALNTANTCSILKAPGNTLQKY